ncbi:MAG: apolipoprotein N-acyltransferase [Acidobacteria bacterium]|nr:MAG: apolipoprotein N-acyltransferase [Acidobacteriota bacterium]PYR19799.1 MAG: apolipoprotein N-acyltransferase [Acidobacteriota bacterium]PYR42243.1 MAG: apolipoprotein N-acyltransferase [Acidobacteriota bacterium]
MVLYGDLQTSVAVLVNGALIAYLALFPAVFALVTRRGVIVHGRPALMAAPFAWVATELGRTHLFTGFPWVLLGYSQTRVLPIAQLASLFGVYGVSMLVAAMSAALAVVAVGTGPAYVGRRLSGAVPRLSGAERFGPLIVVFAILVAVAVWGSRRAAGAEWRRSGEAIRVGLIQGNVDQAEKVDVTRAGAIFQDYLRLTRQAIREGAEFILWPESSTPFLFEEDRAAAAQVRTLARQARVPILLGSDQIERGPGGLAARYFNSAFLVRPDGTTGGVYRKMHLVPFGEYVPLKRVFFFAAPLVEAVSDFSAGETPALLPLGDHTISTAICYEVVYPDLVRRFVAGGSEMLTTMTNDAWFGATSAPYQHFEQASMRAIEEGRYMIRSANTGVSGIVDPYGRVLARTAIFQPAVLVGEARFLRTSTFYARHGDILAYASVVATAALLVVARRRVQ